jgi:hypothetical protein
MTEIKEAFLNELKSKPKLKVAEYSEMYTRYRELAIVVQEESGASKPRAKAMGNYYTITILSDYLDNDHLIARIIEYTENTPV